jgi:hypothetical protein
MAAAAPKLRIVDQNFSDTSSPSQTGVVSRTDTVLNAPRPLKAEPRLETDPIVVGDKLPKELDLEQLYPASAEVNSMLSKTLILLSQALQRIDRAIDYSRAKEPILGDDQMNHLLVLLDELFCLRELSEGFANVVSSCANGIRNLHGEMLEEKQLLSLNSCLLALKKKPLISFDSSDEIIDRLEKSGLNIDAIGTEIVADWLSDEGAG